MRPACLYVNLSINCSSNQSINLAFFFLSLFLSQRSSLYRTLPFPQRCFSLQQSNKQAASLSLFLQKHSVISIGFPCARAVLHRSIVFFKSLYCAVLCLRPFVPLRRNPLARRHSFDPTIFCCIAVSLISTTLIASTRFFPPAFVPYFLVVSHISLLAHFHPRP